jgi:hypothetical protein
MLAIENYAIGALVRAAFRAAADRTVGPLVRAAFREAAARDAGPRRVAALRACPESAPREVLLRFSCFMILLMARDRWADGRRRGSAPCPRS